jgi:hypothetical protein
MDNLNSNFGFQIQTTPGRGRAVLHEVLFVQGTGSWLFTLSSIVPEDQEWVRGTQADYLMTTHTISIRDTRMHYFAVF